MLSTVTHPRTGGCVYRRSYSKQQQKQKIIRVTTFITVIRMIIILAAYCVLTSQLWLFFRSCLTFDSNWLKLAVCKS